MSVDFLSSILLYNCYTNSMLKQHIIQRYLNTNDAVTIIPQHHGKALELMIKYSAMALVLWILHTLITSMMSYDYIVWWVAMIWLGIILLMFNYYFMMLYLDSVVVTPQGLTIMDQVWFLDFSQTNFDWESIQTISYHQHGLSDWLLNKWDIIIWIEHGTNYILPNVVQPTKRVERLNHYKHESIVQRARELAVSQEVMIDNPQYDKFELLVDKLSDIIVDYMKQPRNGDVIDGDSEPKAEDDYPELYKN